MTTKIIAFALLGIFYAAYFGKKIAQKRQGIQTNQIGVGNKTKRILRIERLMGAATLLVVPVEVVSIAVFPQWTLLPWLQNCPALQWVGLTVATMLHIQILQEEPYCRTSFGTAYEAYCKRVRRYL